MEKRIFYIISFLMIFCIEVLIALYVRDSFVRPYMGDALVVVLVYSFVRIFIPTGIPRLPFYVFLFACFVEILQYFQLVETLGITNRALRIILDLRSIGKISSAMGQDVSLFSCLNGYSDDVDLNHRSGFKSCPQYLQNFALSSCPERWQFGHSLSLLRL